MDKVVLKKNIVDAFSDVEPPPDWALVGSNEGAEPREVEKIFQGTKDWRDLHVFKMDAEPALSFLSDEAVRYYLQAFMIHDLDDQLNQNNVVFHLTYGFTDDDRSEKINPRRFGERTRWDSAIYRYSVFSREQVDVIIDYLKFKFEQEPEGFDAPLIQQALENYWMKRSKELSVLS